MNIALSAVIVFILLVPPIAFYISYVYGRFPKSTLRFSVLEIFLGTSILSLSIHGAAVYIIDLLSNSEIRFDLLLKVLGGELKDIEKKANNSQLNIYVKQFALYNFSLLIASILMGRLLRWYTRRRDRHFEHPVFRLYNRWWYLFGGYYLGELGNVEEIENFDFVFIDAVVDTKDGTMIYSGILVDFICHEEELLRLYISNVVRREFKINEAVGDKIVLINKTSEGNVIPGDLFSIEYKNVINLNLKFIVIEEDVKDIEILPDTIPDEKPDQ